VFHRKGVGGSGGHRSSAELSLRPSIDKREGHTDQLARPLQAPLENKVDAEFAPCFLGRLDVFGAYLTSRDDLNRFSGRQLTQLSGQSICQAFPEGRSFRTSADGVERQDGELFVGREVAAGRHCARPVWVSSPNKHGDYHNSKGQKRDGEIREYPARPLAFRDLLRKEAWMGDHLSSGGQFVEKRMSAGEALGRVFGKHPHDDPRYPLFNFRVDLVERRGRFME